MEAFAYALTLIISWGIKFCYAESGFLSLDCGGIENRTDPETGIEWTPDKKYIQGGYRRAHNDPYLEFYQQSLRIFPKPFNKSCYILPITPNVPTLLRLYFAGLNYTLEIPEFKYSIETRDMLSLRNPTPQTEPPGKSEMILVSGGETLYICLIRSREDVDPFISSIELRPLRQGMYLEATPGLMLHSLWRENLGASLPVRYPQYQFDRTWDPVSVPGAKDITSLEPISTNHTRDLPPPMVMETAVSIVNETIDFANTIPTEGNILLLYFAEIEILSGSRIFDILINNETRSSALHLVRNNSATEVSFREEKPIAWLKLSKASNSTMGPMLNALELYQTVNSSTLTSSRDVQALASIKKIFNVSTWISDPCFAYPWEGIKCVTSSVSVRVSEINLSNRNLTGSIPSSLGNMTALIKISMDNNQLSGGLPDLSKLVKLKSL